MLDASLSYHGKRESPLTVTPASAENKAHWKHIYCNQQMPHPTALGRGHWPKVATKEGLSLFARASSLMSKILQIPTTKAVVDIGVFFNTTISTTDTDIARHIQ